MPMTQPLNYGEIATLQAIRDLLDGRTHATLTRYEISAKAGIGQTNVRKATHRLEQLGLIGREQGETIETDAAIRRTPTTYWLR